MTTRPPIDLRQAPAARLCGLLLAHLEQCASAREVCFVLAEDPQWAMCSIDLHLQHRLQWCISSCEPGVWRLTVNRDESAPSADLIGLLLREHRRLDTLFARALQAFNVADLATGTALFAQCSRALSAHLAFEDDVLVPALGSSAEPALQAIEAMGREHAEILEHLRALQSTLAEDAADCSEAAILCAMLSGLLAKHEHREEMSVFPLWQLSLVRFDEVRRIALCSEARARLASE